MKKNTFPLNYMIFMGTFGMISFLITRIILLFNVVHEIQLNMFLVILAFLKGSIFDLFVILFFIIPFIIFIILPKRLINSKIIRLSILIHTFIFVYFFIYNIISEYLFWAEFGVRYNFIAVDYLIYTTEVIHNIVESYPIFKILFGIFLFTLFIFYSFRKKLLNHKLVSNCLIKKIFLTYFSTLIFLIIIKNIINYDMFSNNYLNEISKNGIYSFVQAFKSNNIDYVQFYISKDSTIVENNLKKLLSNNKNYSIINFEKKNENKKNVNLMIVMIESLSAKYMKSIGAFDNLTPNLDSLTEKSLFFTNMYATGTRTVRGLESLVLSQPPSPGSSVIRQKDNTFDFSVGQILKSKGYDNKFLYGGNGYFDNMDNFFANNGFEIHDFGVFDKSRITFKNAWGCCDEDVYNFAISEADLSYSKNKPFCSIIMTTSNHRPYTYEIGKIDIPPGTRAGAVKYTDYAVGELLNNASQKPWFNNTIFVFVADHCSNSAGKVEILPANYHIPCIIYAPKIIKPNKYTDICSQIDITPTILGICNIQYESKFFGLDLLNNNPKRAFLSTYQYLSLFKNNILTILKPNQNVVSYKILTDNELSNSPIDESLLFDTITYYQSCYENKKKHRKFYDEKSIVSK